MNSKLSTLIATELEKRGWSARELGRRSGFTGAYISRIIAGDQKGTFDFCAAIAPHLDKTPEELFRLVGLLPPRPEQGQNEDKLLATFRQLSSQQQQFLLDSARGLQGRPAEPLRIVDTRTTYNAIPDLFRPDLEDIIEITRQLDQVELQNVFDFARFRLIEQHQRRNSSGSRQASEEKKSESRRDTGLIDLRLWVESATPEERKDLADLLAGLAYNSNAHT